MSKTLLAAAAALPLLAPAALSGSAWATLNCTVTDNGVNVGTCLPSNNGALVLSAFTDPQFSSISLTGSGFPALPQPDLSSVTLNVTSATGFTGTHTLVVDVFQSGLAVTGATLSSTFTINHLIGAPFGPSTLSDFINGTASTLGTPLNSASFAAGATNSTIGPDISGPFPSITADAQQYTVTFTAPGQSANDTIQLLGVTPSVVEPSSLALLGGSLVGMGWWYRRHGRARG
jgi:hypothetical protein